jgi:uncharacterized protein
MKDVFEQLIIDFHHSKIPIPSHRELDLPKLPAQVRKAFVFMGIRRSGKTWMLYQQMHELLKKGADQTQLLYINFEDDRLRPMISDNFQCLLEAYFTLYPQHTHQENIHFFFDEIHEIDGWEKFIRRLLDQEKMCIYITGSSSKMLSKEIASALRGRTINREVFPFSFREYLTVKQGKYEEKRSTKQKNEIDLHLKKYLAYGGFPEIANMHKSHHREMLQGYMDVVIYRDLVDRHQISNVHAVRALIKYGIQNSATFISINKIYHRFKSQGINISKNSLYAFTEYLEDAYCLFTVPLFTFSSNKQALNPKKMYCVDQGLMTAYSIKPEFEHARRLENTVFVQLRRTHQNIFYYKTKTGKEVDFLIQDDQGRATLVQVCLSLTDEETRRREFAALDEAAKEVKLKQTIMLTLDVPNTFKNQFRRIQVISLREWLLNTSRFSRQAPS